MEIDEPDLVRYWFGFDLTGHEPRGEPGCVSLDGGTVAYRLLGRGAGVTGYGEADCLRLVRDALGGEFPPVVRSERNFTIEERLAGEVGNVAWRGIWFPWLNMSGPPSADWAAASSSAKSLT